MSSRYSLLAAAAVVVLVGACSSGGGTATPPPVALASLTATSVPAPTTGVAATPGPSPTDIGAGASATPGPIDPCSLLTVDEVSGAIGAKLGAGVSTIVTPDRVCTWKKGLTEVKLFLSPPAPDAATAQAYWDFARSEVPFEIQVSDFTLPPFDRAAFGAGSGSGISFSALFALKGPYGADLFCGFPACSEVNSATAMQLVGNRLP